MANVVRIGLKAEGQALAATLAPAVLASGIVELLHFEVDLSEEWDGFENVAVIVRNGEAVEVCEVVDGEASVDGGVLQKAGAFEVAIIGQGAAGRLTTETAVFPLRDSGVNIREV